MCPGTCTCSRLAWARDRYSQQCGAALIAPLPFVRTLAITQYPPSPGVCTSGSSQRSLSTRPAAGHRRAALSSSPTVSNVVSCTPAAAAKRRSPGILHGCLALQHVGAGGMGRAAVGGATCACGARAGCAPLSKPTLSNALPRAPVQSADRGLPHAPAPCRAFGLQPAALTQR